jgi:hypothetical protein
LVHVPSRPALLTDAELIDRYRALYPHRPRLAQKVEATLSEGGAEAEQLRRRLMARMHDISMFLKELKQRFTMWYNARYKSFGTVWAERFKSLVVENDPSILRTVGAYIDLNSVRAGLSGKPEEYRWCGMSAGDRGDPLARSGISTITNERGWPEARKTYWKFVYDAGMGQAKDKAHPTIDIEDVEGLIAEQALRTRQKSLSEGWVIGSQNFIRQLRRRTT